MFHRDSGAGDSDPAFAWPSGFRDRRANLSSTEPGSAEASASASASASSSSSSPFRHRQNPHFAAHRKSSDQVIQQLRDELDRHRQMFFDRLAPQWDQRAGFPFSDTARRAFGDATERAMPHHFQHHEDIPSWMTEDDHLSQPSARPASRQRWPSGGSARSGGSNSSTASSGAGGPAPDGGGAAETERPVRSDSPGRPRIHKPATRSATGDFPAGSPGSPKMSFNRAGSAPPDADSATSFSTGLPRRGFVINREPPPPPPPPPSQQHTNSPGARRRSQHNEQQGNGHVVRHIPIVVEGRDEPVLAAVAEEEAAEKRSKTAIPMPFYPAVAKESDASSGTSAPKQAKVNQNEEDEHDGTVPIPLPYDQLSGDAGATPPTPASERQTAADLEQISRIQREAETLLPRIESFRGDRHHRDFLYLDEMLTRLLLKLDNVQVEGRDDVRKARRQAIASITRCINLLESKLLDSIDRSSQEPESCSAQCEEPHQRAEASADVATAPGSEANAKKESEGGVEQQRVDEKEAPVAPPPVTHVTQLMINIGGPPASEAPNAEAIQEVN